MAADDTEAAKVENALARIEARSPLLGWLRRHRVRLEAQFAAEPPSWPSVAKVLAELGVLDARGNVPRPEAVRLAWHRVRASPRPSPPAAAVTPPSKPPTPPAAVTPSAVSAPPRGPAFDPNEGETDAPAAPRFSFNLRKATPR